MRSRHKSSFWSVLMTVFMAAILMSLPLPDWLFNFWPDWIALALAFWALSSPDRIGPWVALIVGIVFEVLFVRNFGVMALGLIVLVFLINGIHLQLKSLSVWQQTIVIAVFIALSKLITGWLLGLVGELSFTTQYWYSTLGNILMWPFIANFIRYTRTSTG